MSQHLTTAPPQPVTPSKDRAAQDRWIASFLNYPIAGGDRVEAGPRSRYIDALAEAKAAVAGLTDPLIGAEKLAIERDRIAPAEAAAATGKYDTALDLLSEVATACGDAQAIRQLHAGYESDRDIAQAHLDRLTDPLVAEDKAKIKADFFDRAALMVRPRGDDYSGATRLLAQVEDACAAAASVAYEAARKAAQQKLDALTEPAIATGKAKIKADFMDKAAEAAAARQYDVAMPLLAQVDHACATAKAIAASHAEYELALADIEGKLTALTQPVVATEVAAIRTGAVQEAKDLVASPARDYKQAIDKLALATKAWEAADLHARRYAEGAEYKSTGGKFGQLAGSDQLTPAQIAKFDAGLDTAIQTDPQGDVRKIAQDEADKWLKISRDNMTAGGAFKSTGDKFGELTGSDRLSGKQKAKFDQMVDKAIGDESGQGIKAVDAQKIKTAAQDAIDSLLGMSQANLTAGNDFKTTGGKFSELTGADRLTGAQKTKIDQLIQHKIQNEPNVTLEKVDVKKIAQETVNEIQALAKTGLSDEVDNLIDQSSALKDAIFEFNSSKTYTIKQGPGGIFCTAVDREINLDPAWLAGGEENVVMSISHEVGHARYNFIENNYKAKAKTKADFVKEGVEASLIDEAEATIFNCQVRAEILKNNGPDIGVAGQSGAEYIKIYEKLEKGTIDRQTALQEIADTFRHGESPSITGFVGDYEKYYAEQVWTPIADHRGLM